MTKDDRKISENLCYDVIFGNVVVTKMLQLTFHNLDLANKRSYRVIAFELNSIKLDMKIVDTIIRSLIMNNA